MPRTASSAGVSDAVVTTAIRVLPSNFVADACVANAVSFAFSRRTLAVTVTVFGFYFCEIPWRCDGEYDEKDRTLGKPGAALRGLRVVDRGTWEEH